MLWFGDERGYNATLYLVTSVARLLWFGDERGYNATRTRAPATVPSCGLVMKEDITQPSPIFLTTHSSCGLVMKEDITQLHQKDATLNTSCGLVMKEDITQRHFDSRYGKEVVVW